MTEKIELGKFLESIPALKDSGLIQVDPIPENSKYSAMSFSIGGDDIIYRKGKVTPDRPGAFLTLWQRPDSSSTCNKPIALRPDQLDFLMVEVSEIQKETPRSGFFLFPENLLISKKILSENGNRGKTAFRVFPPWSGDRGHIGMKVFSDSGKKTQKWQLPFFIETTPGQNTSNSSLAKILNYEY
jgi:hypothetical protein